MVTITFEENAKEYILKEVLNKSIDSEGFILDENQNKVLTQNGEELTVDEFGGFENGSEIFVKNDIVSIMEYSNKDG